MTIPEAEDLAVAFRKLSEHYRERGEPGDKLLAIAYWNLSNATAALIFAKEQQQVEIQKH